MTLILEQLFYGCGERGYAILGMSPGAHQFAARVELLCGAVGTPVGNYDGEPFLLSVPDGDHVIMACGRRGAPDSMGRTTLFFHVLVVGKMGLAGAKADAFSLFENRAFSDTMPPVAIAPLAIEAIADRDASTKRMSGGCVISVSLPCAFRSDKPAPKLVCNAIRERANDLAWTTFAFQPLSGFDVQVLSPHISVPRSCNEYDASGKLLRIVEAGGVSGKDGSTSHTLPTHSAPPLRIPKVAPPTSCKPSPMLKFSLWTNAILLILCVALLATRKKAQPVTEHISTTTPAMNYAQVVTNMVTVTNSITIPMSHSARELANIEATAYSNALINAHDEFVRKIPRDEIEACLGKLPIPGADAKAVREWLGAFPRSNQEQELTR